VSYVSLSYPIEFAPSLALSDTSDPHHNLRELPTAPRRTTKIWARVAESDDHATKVAKLHAAILRYQAGECLTPGCHAMIWRGSMCAPHYQARESEGLWCCAPSCRKAAVSKGLCATHYAQAQRGEALHDYHARSRSIRRILVRVPLAHLARLGPDPQARILALIESLPD
jgi:hypothetical protein